MTKNEFISELKKLPPLKKNNLDWWDDYDYKNKENIYKAKGLLLDYLNLKYGFVLWAEYIQAFNKAAGTSYKYKNAEMNDFIDMLIDLQKSVIVNKLDIE